MARFKIDFRADAFRKVLGFTFKHWQKQPIRIAIVMLCVLGETTADLLTPFFAGRLVEAVASGAATNEVAWNAAVTAFLASDEASYITGTTINVDGGFSI